MSSAGLLANLTPFRERKKIACRSSDPPPPPSHSVMKTTRTASLGKPPNHSVSVAFRLRLHHILNFIIENNIRTTAPNKLGSRFVSITEDSKKWLKTPRIMSTKTLLGFNYKTCPIMLPELPWAPRDASVPQHTDNRHPGLVSGTGTHSSRRVSYIQFLD